VHLLKVGSFFSCELVPRFTEQSIHEEPAAHPDSPVNTPDGTLDPRLFQGHLLGLWKEKQLVS